MDVNHATQAPQLDEAELFSLDYFLQETASIAKKKEYPALQQALMDYYRASTLEQYPEKLDTLKQQLATVIDRYPTKNLDYLRRLRNHVKTVQVALERYGAGSPSQLPARLHFAHIGQLLTQRAQRHLALWQAVQEASGESLIIWFDSDALLVERLNQCLLETALQQSFQQQPNSSIPLFLEQLSQNLAKLRESSYQAIQQAIASGQSADLARQQLLITCYQQPAADLTAHLEEHQRLMLQLTAIGITFSDLHININNGPLAKPYQRELLQRGNLTAETQMASLLGLQQRGGSYGTSQALPPLTETFWSTVTQIYLQQQGVISAEPKLIAQTRATIKDQWLQSDTVQLLTWQCLWEHNPEWMPEATAKGATFTEQGGQKYSESKRQASTVLTI